MSDLDKWLEWCRQWGFIPTEISEDESGFQFQIEAKSSPAFHGYTGFFLLVMFDKNKKFINAGVYE